MKRKRVFIGSSILLLIILFFFLISPLLPSFWLYRYEIYLDVNSADQLRKTYICNVLVREKIQENYISKEIKRLGVPVPQGRFWKKIFTGSFDGHYHGKNYEAYSDLRRIELWLQMRNATDADRYDVFNEAMNSLRKDIDTAMDELKALERKERERYSEFEQAKNTDL